MNNIIETLKEKIIVMTTKGNKILPAGDYVFRLTDDIMDDNFKSCVENNYISIREADETEKKTWFENYNENDTWGIGLLNT